MQEYLQINNTRYHIERVFDKNQKVEDIIMRKLLTEKGSTNWLTSVQPPRYNKTGGSIES